LLFDPGEEHPQRRAVRRVAGQHLVSQGKTVRGNHQRDHHLRAVRPLVAAVTMTTLVALRHVRGVDLEVRAGQIVEQHVEIRVEQVTPARHEM
jgi:predicted aconitase